MEVARIQLSRVVTTNTHIKNKTTLPALMVVQNLMTDRFGEELEHWDQA
jgi:hypothetical protein